MTLAEDIKALREWRSDPLARRHYYEDRLDRIIDACERLETLLKKFDQETVCPECGEWISCKPCVEKLLSEASEKLGWLKMNNHQKHKRLRRGQIDILERQLRLAVEQRDRYFAGQHHNLGYSLEQDNAELDRIAEDA